METAVALGPLNDYYPPIKRGDLDFAIQDNVERVIIIDGVFYQDLSVSLDEIRDAIHAGIEIWGASSMGALRAVEAGPLGMYGWGKVYQMYKSGQIDSDDAVALVFDERYKPLSEPLVNIISALDFLSACDVISSEEAHEIKSYVEHLYYPERTFFDCFDHIDWRCSKIDKILSILNTTRYLWDIKLQDAITLLSRLTLE